MRIAVRVFELAPLEHPEERRKSNTTQEERNGDKDAKNVHRAAYFKRNALSDTVSDDEDMARAAISGVASPAMAKGTARTL